MGTAKTNHGTAWRGGGILLALVAAYVILGCGSVRAQEDPPNIVLVLTDDLDVASTGYMPRLESSLMDRGTTFENAFVTDSLCCPSRTTILRGQYPHNHRILGNDPPLGGFKKFRSSGRQDSTVATWLQDAGYRTVLIGKYMNGYDTTYVPPGWDRWYGIAGTFRSTRLNENGRIKRYDPERYHLDDVLADKAVRYVRERGADAPPFFMWLGTKAPHLPATPAPRHENALSDVPLPRPPSFDEKDVSDKPAWVRDNPPLDPRSIEGIEEIRRQRLRSLLAVDEMIGRLVEALRRSGELRNTYIFFTSDNGWHAGEHRLTTGKWTAYEEDIRVPLIVRGPGVPEGRRLGQMALNNDLAPTFADVAGANAPPFVDGRSLRSLLEGDPPEEGWRSGFLVEAARDRPELPARPPFDPPLVRAPLSGDPAPEGWRRSSAAKLERDWGRPGLVAVRTSRYMYAEYETGERELYDLEEDPYELRNRYSTADAALVGRLEGRLDALRGCAGAGCRAAEDGR